jgi:hypothetical protein
MVKTREILHEGTKGMLKNVEDAALLLAASGQQRATDRLTNCDAKFESVIDVAK